VLVFLPKGVEQLKVESAKKKREAKICKKVIFQSIFGMLKTPTLKYDHII